MLHFKSLIEPANIVYQFTKWHSNYKIKYSGCAHVFEPFKCKFQYFLHIVSQPKLLRRTTKSLPDLWIYSYCTNTCQKPDNVLVGCIWNSSIDWTNIIMRMSNANMFVREVRWCQTEENA